MKKTICRIESKFETGGREYFSLLDKENNEEYIIPLDQLFDKEIHIGSEYNFYKKYNSKLRKYFITQEHPFYKLYENYDFPIIRIESDEFNNDIFNFILNDNSNNEVKVKPLGWQSKEWKKATLTCQVIDYSTNGLVLRNIDNSSLPYKTGEIYEFNVVGFSHYENNKGKSIPSVVLKTKDGSEVNITAHRWQNAKLWKHPTVFCEVIRYNYQGVPHLNNKDERHPIYRIGAVYDFTVKSLKTTIDYKNINKKYDIIELIGEDGFTHETNAYPGQMRTLKAGDIIQCTIQSIGYNLRLNQANIKDPYFARIDEIVEDKELITKFFNKAILDKEDEDSIELTAKYDSSSAFWVFTFCNKILSRYFKEHSERYDYKSSKQIASLIITIEEWIIKNGITTSFPDKKARENTLKKAKQQLSKYEKILDVLSILDDLTYSDFFSKRSTTIEKKDIEDLYYVIMLSDINQINESDFYKYIKYLLENIAFKEENNFILLQLDKSLQFNKKIYYNNAYENSFNLSFTENSIFKNDSNKNKYFTFSFCQVLINEKIGDFERSNYLLGKILRQLFFTTKESALKEKLLYNAYFYQNKQDKVDNLPFRYSTQLELIEDNLAENPNCCTSQDDNWSLIKDSLASKSLIKVRITQKEHNGFVVNFQGIKGFLPFNHISDRTLKNYSFTRLDFTLTVECILLSEEFNFYIVKQPSDECKGYLCKNNLLGEISVGEIVEAKIKSIENYGIFVTSYWGDGLLHIKQISSHYWNKDKLSTYFKKGNNITTRIESINQNRVSLSYKGLIDTEEEDKYIDFINYVDFGETFNKPESNLRIHDNSSEDLELKCTQLEKAFCFEQYAVLKNSLDDKIHYLRLSKQFFSSINNARSYLINIYTSYFELLKLIEKVINSFSIEKVEQIKAEAQVILSKVKAQEQTLDVYPESKKLIFFINIISLFNDQSEAGIATLYELLQKNSNQNTLKTIAKITLANNLLTSESKEHSDFARRNLRHIKTYLDDGVLSLKEDEVDKRDREIREKVKYWEGRILEDESEDQEFKSTFKTPLPDNKRLLDKSKLLKLLKTTEKRDALLKKISEIDGDLAIKSIIHSSLKTLCAFANTNGGTLLIGVSDDKSIVGLETDYSNLKRKQNRDGFGLFFDDKIKEYFEASFSSLLKREFLRFNDKDILIVSVKQSFDPIFLLRGKDGKPCEELYVRDLTSTKEIKQKRELVKFVKQKEKEQIKLKIDE